MTTIIATGISVVLALVALSTLLHWRGERRAAMAAVRVCTQLDETLTLIQLTQRHRALGSQRDPAASKREQIARQIEHNWPQWLRDFAEGARIDSTWQYLRGRSDDYVAHCYAIDQLLIVVSRLERRIGLRQIADRCRALEDLGRLRGLSMRAANHKVCPIELEVPLRYLCQRLATLDTRNTAMHAAVHEIAEHLLDAPRVAMTSARCFQLLTPVIDAAIDEVRRSIFQHTAAPEVATRHSVGEKKSRPHARPMSLQPAAHSSF